MSGNSKKKTTKTKTEAEDEVDQLLRVAEDDVLLKLAVNSHLKSYYAINPDLDHRFQALKSGGTKKPNFNRKSVHSNSSSPSVADLPSQPAATTGDVDDLFARFAALKGSLPCYSSSSSTTTTTTTTTSSSKNRNSEEADDDEDEVDKVIRWAVDAVRLDPSPTSDDDDDNDDDNDTDSDDDGQDSDNGRHGK